MKGLLNYRKELPGKDNVMKKLNVAIFFGGCSSEYGVSLESASAVISSMNRERYVPVPVGITREGKWFYFSGDTEKIKDDTWCNPQDCVPAVLSPEREEHKLLIMKDGRVDFIRIDAVFPVLHGKNGEDGTIQGLIELAGIPLVGCGVLASAVCMDKDRAHRLAQAAGIRVPRAVVLESGMRSTGKDGFLMANEKEILRRRAADFACEIGYPLYVKPVKAGSSYGVTRVQKPEELPAAVSLAFQYDNQVIVEENIEGFEVGCAVMGNEILTVGEVDEIELSGGFFDFTEKYTLKTSAIHVPARISSEIAEEIKETGKIIYKALGCYGFARVDMFLTPDGEIVFNEVNTIPGFTEHSRFPGMMKAAGYSFAEILENIIGLAVGL